MLDPDKARHLVRPDLDPNFYTLTVETTLSVASGSNCLCPTKRIENVGFTPQFLCESSLIYKKFLPEQKKIPVGFVNLF